MKDILITWIVTTIILHTATSDGPDSRLVGGNQAPVGTFPAHVGIGIGNDTFCGGTILNPNHVLTAGSCVLDGQHNLIAANQLTVRGGMVNIGVTTPHVAVSRVFVHPFFNPFSFENDIAVLRMADNFTFPESVVPNLAAAQLKSGIVAEGSRCQVVGWNWQPGSANMPLQRLDVSIHPRSECNTMFNGMIRDSMICVATDNANQGLCVSNRGGGLYCDSKLAGIASFGFGCASNATATVFTQPRFHDAWIRQQFVRTDNPQPGTTPMPGIPGGGNGSLGLHLSAVAALFMVLIFMLIN
ncbi:trypsin-like [Toxorhynchites rutilus septentrionalis]|uniref:trypsin-like n=1 Tax=Toxorhynchites rutilus septentrionalis TaxID=329112 RepID=UPI0024795824|nr:trypsin-like [Toxorhynchites rutilus septentrionalis]